MEARAYQPAVFSRRNRDRRDRPGLLGGHADAARAGAGNVGRPRRTPSVRIYCGDQRMASRAPRRCSRSAPQHSVLHDPAGLDSRSSKAWSTWSTAAGTANGLGDGFPTIAGKTGTAERYSRTDEACSAPVARPSWPCCTVLFRHSRRPIRRASPCRWCLMPGTPARTTPHPSCARFSMPGSRTTTTMRARLMPRGVAAMMRWITRLRRQPSDRTGRCWTAAGIGCCCCCGRPDDAVQRQRRKRTWCSIRHCA